MRTYANVHMYEGETERRTEARKCLHYASSSYLSTWPLVIDKHTYVVCFVFNTTNISLRAEIKEVQNFSQEYTHVHNIIDFSFSQMVQYS